MNKIIKPIPLTLGTVIVKLFWINFTKPIQSPMKATPQRLVAALRNWKNTSVISHLKIITLSLTSVVASAVPMNTKPSLMVSNTAPN